LLCIGKITDSKLGNLVVLELWKLRHTMFCTLLFVEYLGHRISTHTRIMILLPQKMMLG